VKGARVTVALFCTECQARNYQSTKKRDQKIEIKKFCKSCGRHTIHRDTK
jgi:large subunit ribosomal protein L33